MLSRWTLQQRQALRQVRCPVQTRVRQRLSRAGFRCYAPAGRRSGERTVFIAILALTLYRTRVYADLVALCCLLDRALPFLLQTALSEKVC